MQMRVGWTLATVDGAPFQESAAFTPYKLATFDAEKEGFGALTVNLAPKTVAAAAATGPVSAEEGRLSVRAFRVHRLPRTRGVGNLEARSKLQGALRIGPHVQ